MFGKLMKNEFRGTWKIMAAIFASFAVMTLLGCISINALMNADNPGALPILTTVVYGMSFFAVFLGVFIYLCNRYYQTMYSAQGYLTHTLPTRESEIFNAKLLVSAIWMIGAILLMLLSMYALVNVLTDGEVHQTLFSPTSRNMIYEDDSGNTLTMNMGGTISLYDFETGNTVDINTDGVQSIQKAAARLIGFTAVCMILGVLILLLWIFASMAIGQLSDKHRTATGILAGIGFYILNQISGITWVVRLAMSFDYDNRFSDATKYVSTMISTIPVYLLLAGAVLYGTCYLINHKKLNLA